MRRLYIVKNLPLDFKLPCVKVVGLCAFNHILSFGPDVAL